MASSCLLILWCLLSRYDRAQGPYQKPTRCGFLILDFPAPRTIRKKMLFSYKLPYLRYSVIAKENGLRHLLKLTVICSKFCLRVILKALTTLYVIIQISHLFYITPKSSNSFFILCYISPGWEKKPL